MKINFSSNLEAIRKSKKISQEELDNFIGTSRQTIILKLCKCISNNYKLWYNRMYKKRGD